MKTKITHLNGITAGDLEVENTGVLLAKYYRHEPRVVGFAGSGLQAQAMADTDLEQLDPEEGDTVPACYEFHIKTDWSPGAYVAAATFTPEF